MTDTYNSIVKATIALLKATGAVTGIVGQRIYTDVPENEVFPYIVLSVESSDYSTKTFTGMAHNLQFNIYSRQASPKQTGDIREAIYNAINRQESAFTLDTGTLSHVSYDNVGSIFKDSDGQTWVGIAQFRAVVT